MLKTVRLPFEGFYESTHSAVFDDYIDAEQEGGSSTPEEIEALHSKDFSKMHQDYAKEYVAQLNHALGISFTFEEMTSPREYNFETDKIFAQVPIEQLQYMLDNTDTPLLRNLAREQFTSRSGFISFYASDIDTWGALDTWDHNQYYVLVKSFIESFVGVEWREYCNAYNLMESPLCNGFIDNLFWSN